MNRFELVPDHMQADLHRWVEDGLPHPELMGSFLRNVLANNLVGAFLHADDVNRRALHDWARTLHCDVPSAAWGSSEKLRAWHEIGGMSGVRLAIRREDHRCIGDE